MLNIPYCFKSSSEEYVTIPVLRKFCKNNNLSTTEDKDELINSIIEFADKSTKNKDLVLEWFDVVLKQGIKHIYFRKIFSSDNKIEFLKKPPFLEKIMDDFFKDCPMNYLISCVSDKELKLQSYVYTSNENNTEVTNISFYFTILLFEQNTKDITNKIIYPIFVDIDLTNNYIFGRAKSKSNIFYIPDSDKFEDSRKTSTDQLISKAFNFIMEKLTLSYLNKNQSNSEFKNYLYQMLKDFTFTPDIIQKEIDKSSSEIHNFISEILKKHNINPALYYDKAKIDMNIFLEKYISISYPDKNIFIKGRDAYPTKLVATDAEFTKIEETTSDREPLQSKERFFDNKKLTDYEQTCDGLFLCYNRINTQYFGKDPFMVKILVSNGFCILRFISYVEEEDIQNVLSRVIRTS